ncbi:MAG: hydrolase [Pirellulaceae bacterium]|nr:hydrolase [Planctomycetales bacterium]
MNTTPQNERNENRSANPLLMSRDDTALLVIDMQQKLLPHIWHHKRVEWNVCRLLQAAITLGIPVGATEQYPQGLGQTIPEIIQWMGNASVPAKLAFSAAVCHEVLERFANNQRRKVLLCGIEAHVCVLQTALDMVQDGFEVFVSVDAVGSRFVTDYDFALRRMEASGVTLVTTEMTMFEWCGAAGSPEFKQISQLARQIAPDDSTTPYR